MRLRSGRSDSSSDLSALTPPQQEQRKEGAKKKPQQHAEATPKRTQKTASPKSAQKRAKQQQQQQQSSRNVAKTPEKKAKSQHRATPQSSTRKPAQKSAKKSGQKARSEVHADNETDDDNDDAPMELTFVKSKAQVMLKQHADEVVLEKLEQKRRDRAKEAKQRRKGKSKASKQLEKLDMSVINAIKKQSEEPSGDDDFEMEFIEGSTTGSMEHSPADEGRPQLQTAIKEFKGTRIVFGESDDESDEADNDGSRGGTGTSGKEAHQGGEQQRKRAKIQGKGKGKGKANKRSNDSGEGDVLFKSGAVKVVALNGGAGHLKRKPKKSTMKFLRNARGGSIPRQGTSSARGSTRLGKMAQVFKRNNK